MFKLTLALIGAAALVLILHGGSYWLIGAVQQGRPQADGPDLAAIALNAATFGSLVEMALGLVVLAVCVGFTALIEQGDAARKERVDRH